MYDSSKAIKTSSRRPTKQCFYVLEPLHWYLHKVKKVRSYFLILEGQQSNKYAFCRANIAIILKSAPVPSCTIPLTAKLLQSRSCPKLPVAHQFSHRAIYSLLHRYWQSFVTIGSRSPHENYFNVCRQHKEK